MKKLVNIICLASCGMALLGCPFESMHPLGELERASIDPRLIGTWTCQEVGHPSGPVDQMRIFQFDEHAYYIELSDASGAEDRLRAYASEIGGQSWLNLQVLSEPFPRAFNFMSYRIEDDGGFVFRVLDDEVLADRHPSAADLVADLTAQLGNPALHKGPGTRCTRTVSKPAQ